MEEIKARLDAMPKQKVIVVSIIESLNAGLTLNEAVVIYATFGCLILVCIKGHTCPNAWSVESETSIRRKLREESDDEGLSPFVNEEDTDDCIVPLNQAKTSTVKSDYEKIKGLWPDKQFKFGSSS